MNWWERKGTILFQGVDDEQLEKRVLKAVRAGRPQQASAKVCYKIIIQGTDPEDLAFFLAELPRRNVDWKHDEI